MPRESAGVISPASEADRPSIEAILHAARLFSEGEIKVAMEVLDVYLFQADQVDYQVFTSTWKGRVAGYVCFGLNAMTVGVFELYWIAVHPSCQGAGVGSGLMNFAESESARQGGRKIAVETSSRRSYHDTLAFYRRRGYREEARVSDFYSIGADKIILVKDL
jgi:ribosomal protein S18 acetylase RimI-like enzyme